MDDSGAVGIIWNALRGDLRKLNELQAASDRAQSSEYAEGSHIQAREAAVYQNVVLRGLRKLEKIKGLPPDILALLLKYDSSLGDVVVQNALFGACRSYLRQ